MLIRSGIVLLILLAVGTSSAMQAFQYTRILSAVDSPAMSDALKLFYFGTSSVGDDCYFEEASYLTSDAVLHMSCFKKFQGGLQTQFGCKIEIADIGIGLSGNSVQKSVRSDDILVVKIVDVSDSARLATSVFGPSFVGTKELKSNEIVQVTGKDGLPISVPSYRLSCGLNQLCQLVVAVQ